MVKLGREDFHAAFILKYLKYTPVTEEDVQKMKHIHVVVDDKESKKLVEKPKRKVVRIKKKSEIEEAPEVQFSKKVKNSSSGLMGFSRRSEIQEAPEVQFSGKVKNSSSGLMVFSRKSEIQEAPEVQFSKKVKNSSSGLMGFSRRSEIQEAPEVQFSGKVKNSSSGLMGFSRKSCGSRCSDGEKLVSSKNQETPGVECGEKVRKITRKSHGSSCFDGEKMVTSKNQETPGVKCDEKVRKNSRKSHGSSCFNGEKLVTSKNQETPGVGCAQKVKKKTRKSYGSSSVNGGKSKRVKISPPRWINAPKLPPIESIKSKIGQCSKPFTKLLMKSDVDAHQGRLLLNSDDVKNHLLPMLNQEEIEDIGEEIKVKTYDPMGNFSTMVFKTRGGGKSYVFLTGWTQFFQQHELKLKDYVVGWMFRDKQTNELCIALTWTKYAGDDKAALNSNSDSSVASHESREIQE